MKDSSVARIILLIFFLLLKISLAQAQSDRVYQGLVMDKLTGETIPYASVIFYYEAELIDGISTDSTGQFQIKINQPLTHIEVSFIGYDKYTLKTTDLQNSADIIIQLQLSTAQLGEVVVLGERTNTQLKIDRKVIHLGADLQQSGTTALEAFDQLSEVQTDLGTGALSLRGSGNVRLLINGKPSAMSASELLAQIPASSIESVEIITSPSAKNQTDGLSGIINILLKKNLEQGLNLSVNAAAGTKRHSYGLTGNYNFSKMNIRWNASQAWREMDSHQTIEQRYTNGSSRDFFAPHDFSGIVRKMAAGLDLFINPKNEVSFEFDYTHDHHDFFNDTFYSNVTDRDDYIYRRNSSHTHETFITNINYRKIFTGEAHFIEFDYNLTGNNNLLPAIDFDDGYFLFEEEKRNDNTLQALAVDYTRPIGNNMKLETGLSWNGREIKSYDHFNFEQQSDIRDIFSYRENLFGVYALTRSSIGKLNWQAGLRYEDFYSSSENSANDQVTDLQFSNLFPSVHASIQVNEESVFNAGYSKRASRPDFNHVNPFRMGNQYFKWNANPNLRPEFSHNLEANYQYNGKVLSYSASAFYHRRKDVIEWLQDIDENGVQNTGFNNIGEKNAIGIESDISLRLTSFWDSQLSANYYHTNIHQDVYLTWDQLYSSGFIVKNTFKIGSHVSADITFRHSGKEQRTFNQRMARNRLDIAARVRMLKNRLTANIRVIDALNDNLMYRKTVTPDVVQQEVWRFQSQTLGVLFSVDYRLFQNKIKERNRKKRNYQHGGSTQ